MVFALVSSTSILFCLVSTFIFVFGLLCGQYLWKRTRKPINQQPSQSEDKGPQDMTSGPIYEDLDAHIIGYEKKMDIELKSNVSYGPLPLVEVQKS